MNSYDCIIKGKPDADSDLSDKIYLLAHVTQDDPENYRLLIDKQRTPIVKFDHSIPIAAPTRLEMINDAQHSLFSANAILRIQSLGYPVITRSKEAYLYPNQFTCPAGRCDMLPQATAMAELNEEILIIIKNVFTGELRTLGFGEKRFANEGKLHKEKELSRSLPPLLTLDLQWLPGPHSYHIIVGNYNDDWEASGDSSILEAGSCIVVEDKKMNTFELCFQLETCLPEEWMIETISDGERYQNQVEIVDSLDCLPMERCVPALKAILLYEQSQKGALK